MPSNYTGSSTSVQAPGPAPGPGVSPIVALPIDADAFNAAAFAQPFKEEADWIDYLNKTPKCVISDGVDGAATLDGAATVAWATRVGNIYTMTRDAFLTSLTINGGVTLKPAGFRLFGTGTLTTVAGAPNGQISCDGNPGVGLTAGAAGSTGTLLSGYAGGNGGAAGVNPGNSGSNQTGFAGAGGHGGDGTSVPGNGGTMTAPAASLGRPDAFNAGNLGTIQGLSGTTVTFTAIGGGAGGGGGGGAAGGVTGGGGAGGGVMVIVFRALSLASAADIHCTGGAGANGTIGCGGGGGGGGGVLIIAYGSKNAVTFSAATNCAGGAAGSGPTVVATAGSTGALYEFLMS